MAKLRLPLDYKENVHYSVRDLSVEKRTTLKLGVHTPIYFKKLYPGDKFDLDLATLLQSAPFVYPIFGSFNLRLNVIFQPDTNHYGWLDNNTTLTTQELLTRKRHYIPKADLPFYLIAGPNDIRPYNAITRGSLMDFLGVPPVSFFTEFDSAGKYVEPNPEICADRLLTYLDTARNYFHATQTTSIPYLFWYWDGRPQVHTVEKAELDEFFIWLRQQKDGVSISPSNEEMRTLFPTLCNFLNNIRNGSLFCAQYEPDMLRNLLYNVDTSKIMVNVENGTFSIDTLRFQNKLQRLVDRYDVSGGIFSNWLKTVWGRSTTRRMDIPQFIGTTSVVIDTNTITATSPGVDSQNEVVDVGQMSSNVNQSNYKGSYNNSKKKNFHHYISTDEPGTLMITVSLVPNVDYSQGIERDVISVNCDDEYKPQFAQLGYADVPYSDYCLIPPVTNGVPVNSHLTPKHVVGKQIAWMHLMSDVNRVHGDFAEGGYYNRYVLSRRYGFVEFDKDQQNSTVVPLNTILKSPSYYVDPREWTYMFTNESDFTFDNWLFQLGINIRAVRPIGKRYMPTLE